MQSAIPWMLSCSQGRLTRAGDPERSTWPIFHVNCQAVLEELGRLDLQLRLWAGEYGEAGLRRGAARPVPCCTVISATAAHRACTGGAAGEPPRPFRVPPMLVSLP